MGVVRDERCEFPGWYFTLKSAAIFDSSVGKELLKISNSEVCYGLLKNRHRGCSENPSTITLPKCLFSI